MKKLLSFAISLLLVLAFTACDSELILYDGSATESDTLASTDNSNNGDTTDKETKSEETKPSNNNSNQSSDSDDNNNGNNTNTDNSTPTPSINVNNGVLQSATAESMVVPENMQFLGTNNATEENNSATITATVVLYCLDGDVIKWTTENDFVYAITSGNNRLVAINSKTMEPLYNTPLSGVPAEMNIIGDKIYISLPDLCRIDIFSKADGTKESSLYFDHEVSSFCIEGDYIYYSEHDQFCRVFKKNLVTDEITQLTNDSLNTFFFPKLYLNTEDRILYVGESKTTGSTIFYYDADTLELKSMFRKDDYGIMNQTREIFHVGDYIFWGNYRISDTNAKHLEGRYGVATYGSVVAANEEFVSTYEGLFLTDTYECVIDYFDASFDFDNIIVSDSYNIFFRSSKNDKNIIIGINFDIQ